MTEFDPVAYINEPRWRSSRLGLERIEELLDRLGRPQDSLRFVHVAGTNGKGSTSTYIACILEAAGYKTGLFTSPYIEHFCDRIKIDGTDITLDALRSVTEDVRAVAEEMEDHPTEFELMTAVAFHHFAREACDIAVVEVGLGGTLDSTNVIANPEVSVITAIGLDHQDCLGETLAEIAGEKAGIIKHDVPVVSWPQEPEAMEVVSRVAKEKATPVTVANFEELKSGSLNVDTLLRGFSYRTYQHLETRMIGSYQPANAAVALEAVEILRVRGWDISDEALRAGIAHAFVPGRLEVYGYDPLFLIDGAHNAEGVEALCASLEEINTLRSGAEKFIFLVGVLEDKSYPKMVSTLVPLAKAFVAVAPPNPRALSAHELADTMREKSMAVGVSDLDIVEATTFEQAIREAVSRADKDDIICACGSLYSVASLKAAYVKSK